MTTTSEVFILITVLTRVDAVSLWEQLNHINEAQKTSQVFYDDMPSRRVFEFNRYEGGGTILGVPSIPSHLPAAEHVLPGHTLVRPALGMLKSAVKFPHRENENGEGVYGNQNNLGIRYDGRNERVLYSGFRRMPLHNKLKTTRRSDYRIVSPSYYSGLRVGDAKRSQIEQAIDLLGKLGVHVTNNRIKTNNKNMLGNVYLREDDESTEEDDQVTEEETNENGPSNNTPQNDGKMWFWNSKDMFDHLNINQNALEYSELIPTEATEPPRQWNFYHKEDE